MVDLNKLLTEQQNPNTMDLDKMSVSDALQVMSDEDKKVQKAVEAVIPDIEQAVHLIVKQFKKGGRLIYIGAGTSGRLGVLDASECPPTFGTPSEKVIGIIAGGRRALTDSIEASEDSKQGGADDLKEVNLTEKDVVVGIAASGRTPYVIGALEYANDVGAATVAIACNKNSEIGQVATIAIEPTPGPEILTGSTRLKSGTAQKLVLNMLSTMSMVGIGKVYKNLMVDVQQSNEKLVTRAEKIVSQATDVDRQTAKEALKKSDGSVKLAILMILLNIDKEEAVKRLDKANGHIREAL